MRHYPCPKSSLQATLRRVMPLSEAQASRVSDLGEALLLAGEVPLTKIARFLPQRTQQDSRVRWIRRLLQARFMRQAHLYAPFLKHYLNGVQEAVWHLVIDRTNLWEATTDLATISLNYRKRAIPLVWCLVPFGGAPLTTYVDLLRQAFPLVPNHVQVIFHGDTEFGGAEMIHALRKQGWDFILAQPNRIHFRDAAHPTSQPLSSLNVTRTRTVTRANIQLFADHRIAHLNLLAFYQPHHARGRRKRAVCYLATSLPLTPSLRRLGRRRWGTEPFYRDYKSSGWKVTFSQLKHPQAQEGLLLMLALVYLWSVACGRWLCKVGRRSEVDAKAKRQRHLSLFRIGWDWLIHQLRCRDPVPLFSRLYS